MGGGGIGVGRRRAPEARRRLGASDEVRREGAAGAETENGGLENGHVETSPHEGFSLAGPLVARRERGTNAEHEVEQG